METNAVKIRPADAVADARESAVNRAGRLYGINGWGDEFFSILDDGKVCVHLGDRSKNGQHASASLASIISELEARGVDTPVLLRFPYILERRIEQLNGAFAAACQRTGYQGEFRGVFPIKVNQQQQVVEEVTTFGRRFHYGLEAGSKPELIAAIAYLKDPEALVVCNGYKDRQFVDLALYAQKMGLGVILVIETPHELDIIEERAQEHGIIPRIGIRMKLSSEGTGYWSGSGGEQSPFGLNFCQLVEIVDKLRDSGHLSWVQMLHCHQGSQIPRLETIRASVREASRIYTELVAEGASMGMLNLGGGLAVDYDGTRSDEVSSAEYGIPEYCEALVEIVKEVCDEAGVTHPTLVTESGRAIAAYYSVLAIKIMDVDQFEIHKEAENEAISDKTPPSVQDLIRLANDLTPLNLVETYRLAAGLREKARELFSSRQLNLREHAGVEQIYWRVLTKIRAETKALDEIPEPLEVLDSLLADHYFANFSIFQSLADSWAIGQQFPVMPLQRLNELPTRTAVVNDLTCDCDGMIKSYIVDGQPHGTVPLHEVGKDEDYYIGVFLVGAYQETLSDLHNLFGDAHVVSIQVSGGELQFTDEVEGDTVSDVLSYVEHDPKQLVRNFRQLAETAVAEGRITARERKRALDAYRAGMTSYTYLSQGN